MKAKKSVVVVGAGVAGLACAKKLASNGLNVKVIEKSDRPGGRCTSVKLSEGIYDHGAQYFTARETEFQKVVQSLKENKYVDELNISVRKFSEDSQMIDLPSETRYIGVPTMGAIAEGLSMDLSIHYSSQVMSLTRCNGTWEITTLEDRKKTVFHQADIVVLAMPVDQILQLDASKKFKSCVGDFRMSPCWAVMLSFDQKIPVDYSALLITSEDSAISWVMKDSAKKHRQGFERWVIHAGPSWSKKNIHLSPEKVGVILSEEFRALTQASRPVFAFSKLWRYASGGRENRYNCIVDHEHLIIGCGDWASGGRIEGAWLSGSTSARVVLQMLAS